MEALSPRPVRLRAMVVNIRKLHVVPAYIIVYPMVEGVPKGTCMLLTKEAGSAYPDNEIAKRSKRGQIRRQEGVSINRFFIRIGDTEKSKNK